MHFINGTSKFINFKFQLSLRILKRIPRSLDLCTIPNHIKLNLCKKICKYRSDLVNTKMAFLDSLLPVLETYKGRDKFLRLLSYSSKCAAGLIKSPQTASQFDNFSKQLSTSRACFRLLDDIPTIVEIISKKETKKDESVIDKIVSLVENIVDIIFSPLDHVSWAIEHQIIISNSTFWDTASVWCWVISLYINIYKTVMKLSKLSHEKTQISLHVDKREYRRKLAVKQWYLKMSALKCATDLLFAVNYLPRGVLWAQFFSKWQVGALGTFSSIISLYQGLMLYSI